MGVDMEKQVKRYYKGHFIYGEPLEGGKFQKVCSKCGGKGVLQHFHRTDNGLCYDCMGSGKGAIIKAPALTDDEIKDDIIARELDKRRKQRIIPPPAHIIESWKAEPLEKLARLFDVHVRI